jgi:hypothetical protein
MTLMGQNPDPAFFRYRYVTFRRMRTWPRERPVARRGPRPRWGTDGIAARCIARGAAHQTSGRGLSAVVSEDRTPADWSGAALTEPRQVHAAARPRANSPSRFDSEHACRMDCSCRERRCGHAAALALGSNVPPYSITSSARASSVRGMSMPIVFAVWRLMISWNFVGVCTGRSAGLTPLRTRSTYSAVCRKT